MEAACCQGHAGLHYVSLLWLGSVAVDFCVVGPLDPISKTAVSLRQRELSAEEQVVQIARSLWVPVVVYRRYVVGDAAEQCLRLRSTQTFGDFFPCPPGDGIPHQREPPFEGFERIA